MIRFHLNGQPVEAPGDLSLTRILREHLGSVGTKPGCEIGRCGACMVLVDGGAVNSCLMLGWQVEGRAVMSIEGLALLPVGEALRRGMIAENAFQCGYCAPGVMMTLAGLLSATPAPDLEAVRSALEGNLCRCTGYASILRGAARAIELLNEA